MSERITNRLLGYPDDARLLLVNADDYGLCHAVNTAVEDCLRAGVVRSTSLMPLCPWARYGMRFLTAHPEVDFGIHLTAIGESDVNTWRPLLPRDQVASLVAADGFFYPFDRMAEFFTRVNLGELEQEWRAQIEAVLAAGLRPTHLDWHSLRLDGHDEITNLLYRLARAYGLALRVTGHAWIEQVHALGLPCPDHDLLDSYGLHPPSKRETYLRLLRELPAGLSEWAAHPAIDTPEQLALEPGDLRTRQADSDFFTSPDARAAIEAEGIILVDYRALQALWAG